MQHTSIFDKIKRYRRRRSYGQQSPFKGVVGGGVRPPHLRPCDRLPFHLRPRRLPVERGGPRRRELARVPPPRRREIGRVPPPPCAVAANQKSTAQKVAFKAVIRNIYDFDTVGESFGLDIWMGAWTVDRKQVQKEDKEERSRAGGVSGYVPMSQSVENGRVFAADVFQNALRYGKFDNAPTEAGQDLFRTRRPVWHLNLQNAQDVKDIYAEKSLPRVRVFDDGTCYERLHAECKVLCDLDLTDFPLDFQLLEFVVSLDVTTDYATFDTAHASDQLDKSLDGYQYIYKDSTVNNKDGMVASEWHLANSMKRRTLPNPAFPEDAFKTGVVAHGEKSETTGDSPYSRINPDSVAARPFLLCQHHLLAPAHCDGQRLFRLFHHRRHQGQGRRRVQEPQHGQLPHLPLDAASDHHRPQVERFGEAAQDAQPVVSHVHVLPLLRLHRLDHARGYRRRVAAHYHRHSFSLVFLFFASLCTYAVGKYWCCAKRRREVGREDEGGVFFQRLVDGQLRSIHDTVQVRVPDADRPGGSKEPPLYKYDPWQFNGNHSWFYHLVDAVASCSIAGLRVGIMGYVGSVLYLAWWLALARWPPPCFERWGSTTCCLDAYGDTCAVASSALSAVSGLWA